MIVIKNCKTCKAAIQAEVENWFEAPDYCEVCANKAAEHGIVLSHAQNTEYVSPAVSALRELEQHFVR